MQNNSVLASGLRNPRCMAALELMQKNPTEAKKKFGNDPEVNSFVMEFGKVMGSHFTGLGEKESTAAAATSSQKPRKMISEIDSGSRNNGNNNSVNSSTNLGPLAKAAIDRELRLLCKHIFLHLDNNYDDNDDDSVFFKFTMQTTKIPSQCGQ